MLENLFVYTIHDSLGMVILEAFMRFIHLEAELVIVYSYCLLLLTCFLNF